MSLPTLPKVQKLQEALHVKAKGSPSFRFHALYDKVYREDVLYVAYRRCRVNDGAPGVDGQTFRDIEAYGEKRWLDESYAAVDSHVRHRLRQWLCAKHKVPGQGTSRFPDEYLYQELGLARLSMRTRNFSWAKT